jgi:hypothetical protein
MVHKVQNTRRIDKDQGEGCSPEEIQAQIEKITGASNVNPSIKHLAFRLGCSS